MKPPTPDQCAAAAKALRRVAVIERADDDCERADVLDKAAEIMEAKALVGVVLEIHRRREKP